MRARFLLAVLVLSAPAAAQSPADAAGLQWAGASGNTAGTFCWGFQCAPSSTSVAPGESVTLLVRGVELNAIFLVGVSATATSCIPIPGIAHSLVLDPPIYVAFSGILDQPSPILACPDAYKTIPFVFPSTAIPGSSFGVQAFVLPNSTSLPPTFTQAIVITVS